MIIHKITDNVNLGISNFPIGIRVSGGTDSALLLYFVMLFSKHPIHIFSFANQEKHLINPMKAIQVISKCAELTGNYNFEHHIDYAAVETKENPYRAPIRYVENGTIQHIYTGITKNPPYNVTSRFFGKYISEENSEDHERSPIVKRDTMFGLFYRPWTNIDKREIANIYQKYDLLDNLFPLTRSCEWKNEEYHGENPGTSHCGKCWWCQERYWGFGRL